MNLSLDELIPRLKADPGYVDSFRRVFSENISSAHVASALASFVRTLRSGNSPVDRFQHGERAALSTEAQRGMATISRESQLHNMSYRPEFHR